MVELKYVLIVFLMCIRFIKTELEGKIIEGEYARISEHPHSVYLLVSCKLSTSICGSSVLNQKILLTAAHCFNDCSLKSMHTEAYAGSDDLDKVKIKRDVHLVKIHDGYNEQTNANDIALATLRGTLPLGNNIKRVIIPNRFPLNLDATVAGWGAINERGDSSLKLKATYQKVRSNLTCYSRLRNLPRGMFCAGGTSDYDRPDQGDSGGALIVEKSKQIGLVSYRRNSIPTLIAYTNVTYFYNWIMTHSRALYCS